MVNLCIRCETGVNNVPLAFQCKYRCIDEGGENEAKDWESGYCLASHMRMAWFYVESRQKTKEQWWDVLLIKER